MVKGTTEQPWILLHWKCPLGNKNWSINGIDVYFDGSHWFPCYLIDLLDNIRIVWGQRSNCIKVICNSDEAILGEMFTDCLRIKFKGRESCLSLVYSQDILINCFVYSIEKGQKCTRKVWYFHIVLSTCCVAHSNLRRNNYLIGIWWLWS